MSQIVGCGIGVDMGQVTVLIKYVFDAVDAQAISIPVDKEGSGSGGHFQTGLYPQV